MPEDCKLHEERIDQIQAEIHKHGGWFKILGAGIVMAFSVCGWFGQGINSKLDAIQSMLHRGEVNLMEHSQRLKNSEQDIQEIKQRLQLHEQNSR